jgi:hypothetical protein
MIFFKSVGTQFLLQKIIVVENMEEFVNKCSVVIKYVMEEE